MKKVINYKLQKILLFIYFSFICLNNLNSANAKTYKIGTTFEKNIKFSNTVVLPLSDGKWEVVDRYTDSYAFLYFKGNAIAKVENNELMERTRQENM